jgi:hypothetical protein
MRQAPSRFNVSSSLLFCNTVSPCGTMTAGWVPLRCAWGAVTLRCAWGAVNVTASMPLACRFRAQCGTHLQCAFCVEIDAEQVPRLSHRQFFLDATRQSVIDDTAQQTNKHDYMTNTRSYLTVKRALSDAECHMSRAGSPPAAALWHAR